MQKGAYVAYLSGPRSSGNWQPEYTHRAEQQHEQRNRDDYRSQLRPFKPIGQACQQQRPGQNDYL